MITLFAIGVAALTVTAYAISRQTATATPEKKSIFVSSYVACTIFGSAIGLLTTYLLALKGHTADLGALGAVMAGSLTSGFWLAVGLLGLVACFAGNPGHVTRFRLFVLSFGVGIPALFGAVLFWGPHLNAP